MCEKVRRGRRDFIFYLFFLHRLTKKVCISKIEGGVGEGGRAGTMGRRGRVAAAGGRRTASQNKTAGKQKDG